MKVLLFTKHHRPFKIKVISQHEVPDRKAALYLIEATRAKPNSYSINAAIVTHQGIAIYPFCNICDDDYENDMQHDYDHTARATEYSDVIRRTAAYLLSKANV